MWCRNLFIYSTFICFVTIDLWQILQASKFDTLWSMALNFVHVVKRKYCTICRKRQANKEGISFVTVFTALLVFPVLLIQEKVCWKRCSHFQERPDHTHRFLHSSATLPCPMLGWGAGAYPNCHWVRVHPVLVTRSVQGILPDCAQALSWSLKCSRLSEAMLHLVHNLP